MKNIKLIIILLIGVLTTFSCETYDDYNQVRETVVGFTRPNENIAGIPINGTKDKSTPVFASDVSSVDRSFTVSIVEELTDVSSANYSFDPTITIPAGERTTMFTITAIDVDLTNEFQNITVSIVGTEDVVSGGVVTFAAKTL